MRKNNSHWIQRTHIFRRDEYECSACGYRASKPYVSCPNCGTQIKRSKYDPSWVDEMEALNAIFDD